MTIDTRVAEASDVLKQLGFPKAQFNECASLTLLALLDLRPADAWSSARSPLRGITEMMGYFAEHYEKEYAPNSRETVRRKAIHQFVAAGMVVRNPDDPKRAVNSAKNVYQVIPEAVELFATYGTPEWAAALKVYKAALGTLRAEYAKARDMERVPVKLPSGEDLSLSPGGQNPLVKCIVEEFLPRFTPGADVLYVGDTETKWVEFDAAAFMALGLKFDSHGKFPDVIVYDRERGWLLLIEAVTSHGPVDAKRHAELYDLFGTADVGLVYVTTFLDKATFRKFVADIAWETEVWIATDPTHMIHFNGERFLGPYDPPE